MPSTILDVCAARTADVNILNDLGIACLKQSYQSNLRKTRRSYQSNIRKTRRSYQSNIRNMIRATNMISAANVVSVTNMVNATTCANAKIPKGQNTKIPTCQNVKMSKCPNAKMSKCQNVKMTKCQNDKVPKAKIPKCYTALLNWTLQMAEAIGVHHHRRKNTVCYKTPLAHLVPSAWLEGEPVWIYVCVRPDVEALGNFWIGVAGEKPERTTTCHQATSNT